MHWSENIKSLKAASFTLGTHRETNGLSYSQRFPRAALCHAGVSTCGHCAHISRARPLPGIQDKCSVLLPIRGYLLACKAPQVPGRACSALWGSTDLDWGDCSTTGRSRVSDFGGTECSSLLVAVGSCCLPKPAGGMTLAELSRSDVACAVQGLGQ